MSGRFLADTEGAMLPAYGYFIANCLKGNIQPRHATLEELWEAGDQGQKLGARLGRGVFSLGPIGLEAIKNAD